MGLMQMQVQSYAPRSTFQRTHAACATAGFGTMHPWVQASLRTREGPGCRRSGDCGRGGESLHVF